MQLENGKRRVTPEVVRSYLEVFGDDVNRRELLLSLAAGSVAGAPLLREAYEHALQAPALTAEGWMERVTAYEAEFISILGNSDLQERVAADLARIRPNLDHPVLGVVAARLTTLHGVLLSNATLDMGEAARWFKLGVRAADRSGSLPARVLARGRAAMNLAYHGADIATVDGIARDALGISGRPSLGRLYAELALHQPEQAWITFMALPESELVEAALSEWRMGRIIGRLAARRGDEAIALPAIEAAERQLPADVTWPRAVLELQRALLMVKCGDQKGGIDHAVNLIDCLPPREHRPTIQRLLMEITQA
jgi:hypothetical protein